AKAAADAEAKQRAEAQAALMPSESEIAEAKAQAEADYKAWQEMKARERQRRQPVIILDGDAPDFMAANEDSIRAQEAYLEREGRNRRDAAGGKRSKKRRAGEPAVDSSPTSAPEGTHGSAQ
ncbi:MAG: hypothetical protein EBV64_01965, partial [Oxalobacteraceae bacterium]|nr:hypothetical protein [Oxalobacteraceae bacterium]